MIKKVLMAAGMAAAMCQGAQASGSALDALRGSANAEAGVEVPAAGAADSFKGLRAAGTPIDGWLEGGQHDHYARDANGSGLNHVLYVTLVKSDDKLYLQAFSPGRGKLDYLANFITSPGFALEDVASLRSDQGRPYLVAFETYSTAVPSTNMLVVEFDGAGMLRFAIIQRFPTSEIKGGKFKPYVPSDADSKAWSPWVAIV
jgi:hypothetical protein